MRSVVSTGQILSPWPTSSCQVTALKEALRSGAQLLDRAMSWFRAAPRSPGCEPSPRRALRQMSPKAPRIQPKPGPAASPATCSIFHLGSSRGLRYIRACVSSGVAMEKGPRLGGASPFSTLARTVASWGVDSWASSRGGSRESLISPHLPSHSRSSPPNSPHPQGPRLGRLPVPEVVQPRVQLGGPAGHGPAPAPPAPGQAGSCRPGAAPGPGHSSGTHQSSIGVTAA